MHKAVTRVRQEFVKLLPAVLFFFVAFCLVVMTENQESSQYGVRAFRFAGAAIAALLIAKVILIVDLFPFVDAFRSRPLIYTSVWKTVIYVLAALLFVYLEHVVPLLVEHRDVATAHQKLLMEMVWPRFTAMLIWLAVLFFLFAAGRELSRAIGKGQLRHLFIGR